MQDLFDIKHFPSQRWQALCESGLKLRRMKTCKTERSQEMEWSLTNYDNGYKATCRHARQFRKSNGETIHFSNFPQVMEWSFLYLYCPQSPGVRLSIQNFFFLNTCLSFKLSGHRKITNTLSLNREWIENPISPQSPFRTYKLQLQFKT